MLFGFAFSWVFAFIGLKTGEAETAQLAGFVIIFPLVFASSAFVPTASMPGWLQTFANHQPVTQTANAIRALSQGGEVAGPLARGRSCGSPPSLPSSYPWPSPNTAAADPGVVLVSGSGL